MYPDTLYNILGTKGIGWIGIAILYAVFDYLFNTVMCYITGGIQKVRGADLPGKPKGTKTVSGLRRIIKNFQWGGNERIAEFRRDRLSWLWPFTILLIPIAMLGISREILANTIESLNAIGILYQKYRLLPIDYMQYIIWGIALLSSSYTLYRYQKLRKTRTWFSKSLPFELFRSFLFDLPLSFAIMSIITLWLDFASALYRILGDRTLTFNVLHTDLMYGLSMTHDAVIWLSIGLVALSLLPTIMILREHEQEYSRIYKFGIYFGLIAVFVLNGVLINQFSGCLKNIHENALASSISSISLFSIKSGVEHQRALVEMQYFAIIKDLPKNFQMPTWLNFAYAARFILGGYEITKATTSDKISSLSKVISSIKEII